MLQTVSDCQCLNIGGSLLRIFVEVIRIWTKIYLSQGFGNYFWKPDSLWQEKSKQKLWGLDRGPDTVIRWYNSVSDSQSPHLKVVKAQPSLFLGWNWTRSSVELAAISTETPFSPEAKGIFSKPVLLSPTHKPSQGTIHPLILELCLCQPTIPHGAASLVTPIQPKHDIFLLRKYALFLRKVKYPT